MRKWIATLAAGLLVGVAVTSAGVASAGSAPARSHQTSSSFAPVIVEWFSRATPRGGEFVTLFVRYVNNNQPIPGAGMRATVKLNSRVLLTLKGTKTSAKGLSRAKFRIPQEAAGHTLLVPVRVTYQHHTSTAINKLRVSA